MVLDQMAGPARGRTRAAAADELALQPLAAAPVAAVAVAVVCVLVAVAGRYGYHRDELYFLAAGHHLAWGYPDQPPLVPALARLLSGPGSVAVLRLPSALAGGSIVTLTSLTARELGAGRAAQVLAAVSIAAGAVLLGMGHLLSTATFDVLAWSLIVWLVVRLLRTGDDRLWVVVGVVAGAGLLDSDLVAFLMAAIVVGLLIVGPRRVLRSPWLWMGGLVAALMWSPYLVWQATHGWPQLAVSRSIAAGNSGTSQPRWLLLPEQLVLLSPWLAPIWIAGLVRLFRDRHLRAYRALGVAYLMLAALFEVTGGKSYYLAGLFPLLVATGAGPAIAWVSRGAARRRRQALHAAVAVSAAGSVVVTLPIVPVSALHETPIVAANYDTGETVGWPAFVAEIAHAYHQLPPVDERSSVIVASNYGEAGAVDRYGPALGLPEAFGVQNGYWYWGPPPASATTALAVGFSPNVMDELCVRPNVVTRLNNHVRVDDDEQGAPVWFCPELRAPWKVLWPKLRVIG